MLEIDGKSQNCLEIPGKLIEMARNGWTWWKWLDIWSIKVNQGVLLLQHGRGNTREVAGLGDFDPILACTAEQAPTKSHPMLTDRNKQKSCLRKLKGDYKTETGCRLQVQNAKIYVFDPYL